MSIRNYPAPKCDPDTEAWFKTKPKWFVTTLCICPKCGLSYKASIGHRPENCKTEEAKTND